jgi:glutaminyl-peptide cyclotransferase
MTPLGEKNFTNIIVTKQPETHHRLVLAAHYDSKYSPHHEFIGATDSAVPCAILLSLAETLNDHLDSDSDWSSGRRKRKTMADQTSLELIFFDGEEAFVQWTDTDSIYGARHLAEKWETTSLEDVGLQQQQQQQQQKELGAKRNRLDMMDVLVLLDLMGTTNPTFHNYFPATSGLFHHLASLEKRLGSAATSSTASWKQADDGLWKKLDRFGEALLPMFPTERTRLTYQSNAMSDDHIPFKDRGVDILHLIPYPYPNEWHTPMVSKKALNPCTKE